MHALVYAQTTKGAVWCSNDIEFKTYYAGFIALVFACSQIPFSVGISV